MAGSGYSALNGVNPESKKNIKNETFLLQESWVEAIFFLRHIVLPDKVLRRPQNDLDLDFIVIVDRSSSPEVICKKGVLRNFAKFTGKHLCQSLFFN